MDAFQSYIENKMRQDRQRVLASSGQLTLGTLISKLESIEYDSEPEVVFDFEYLFPTRLISWRGIYGELSLEFSSRDNGNPKELTEFIKMLKAAIGQVFYGYKGGEFEMSEHTPIWVANYGNSGNTMVIDAIYDGYEVILITKYQEPYD